MSMVFLLQIPVFAFLFATLFYCAALARRVKNLNDLEFGLAGC